MNDQVKNSIIELSLQDAEGIASTNDVRVLTDYEVLFVTGGTSTAGSGH